MGRLDTTSHPNVLIPLLARTLLTYHAAAGTLPCGAVMVRICVCACVCFVCTCVREFVCLCACVCFDGEYDTVCVSGETYTRVFVMLVSTGSVCKCACLLHVCCGKHQLLVKIFAWLMPCVIDAFS